MYGHAMSGIVHIYVLQPVYSEMYRVFRRHLPSMAGAFAFACVIVWRVPISNGLSSEDWDVGALYAAIFDWSSIQSAFLFGIYAFLLGRTEPFLKAIAETPAFERMRAHVRLTMIAALILTLVALPLLVARPIPSSSLCSFSLWAFGLLAFFTAYTSASFIKVVRVFWKIERVNKGR